MWDHTPGKNRDYYKKTKDHSDIDIAYSARSSGTTYKHKNGFKIFSQESWDLVRSINENLITLEHSSCLSFLVLLNSIWLQNLTFDCLLIYWQNLTARSLVLKSTFIWDHTKRIYWIEIFFLDVLKVCLL